MYAVESTILRLMSVRSKKCYSLFDKLKLSLSKAVLSAAQPVRKPAWRRLCSNLYFFVSGFKFCFDGVLEPAHCRLVDSKISHTGFVPDVLQPPTHHLHQLHGATFWPETN